MDHGENRAPTNAIMALLKSGPPSGLRFLGFFVNCHESNKGKMPSHVPVYLVIL